MHGERKSLHSIRFHVCYPVKKYQSIFERRKKGNIQFNKLTDT